MSPVLERPILVLPGGKVSSGVFILGSSAWRQISGGPVEIRLFSPSISKSEGAEMSVLNLPFRPSISGELACISTLGCFEEMSSVPGRPILVLPDGIRFFISNDSSGPLRSKPTFPLLFLYGSSLSPSPAQDKQFTPFLLVECKFSSPEGALPCTVGRLSLPCDTSASGAEMSVPSLPSGPSMSG